MKIKAILSFSSSLLLCVLLYACGSKADADGEPAVSVPQWGMKWTGSVPSLRADLTAAVMPMWDCLPLAVAYERGFFEAKGVKVNLKCLDAQMDCDTALRSGSVDLSITDLVRAERLRRQGVPIEYLTATDTQWKLIANKGARLTATSQLGDKMVAMARYSATDLFTTLMISEGKPKNTVFRLQVNSLPVRLKMVMCNAMDAAWLPEPQATQALQAGHNQLTVKAVEGLRMGVIAVRKDTTATKKYVNDIEKFRQAYNQAVDSLNRYGAAHYADAATSLCNISDKALQALDKQRFSHASAPRQSDISRAQTNY